MRGEHHNLADRCGAFGAIVAEGRRRYGERFDSSDLVPAFAIYHRVHGIYPHARIRVAYTLSDGTVYERTGQVGMTTGHRPAFLLMHRSSDHGSSDVLGPRDRIVAVKHAEARSYRPLHPSEV